jgi:hypothetical protein
MADDRERNGSKATPEERYREFQEKNEAWDRRVEETLSELDDAPQESASRNEATPA